MNEALILEKLDQLSAEVSSLKSDVLQDIKKDLEPVLKDAVPSLANVLEDIDDRYTKEKAIHLAQNVLTSLDELNDIVDTVKAGMKRSTRGRGAFSSNPASRARSTI